MDRQQIIQIITDAANRHGVSPAALIRVAEIESGLNPSAQNPNSSAGGLFQFIDATARDYRLADRFDPFQAADAGARLMAANARGIRNALGRDASGAELYLAHQQGLGGAIRLLGRPNASAVDVVGRDAVRLNAGADGMTAGEFASLWLSKFNEGGEISGGGGVGAAVGQEQDDQINDSLLTQDPEIIQDVYRRYVEGELTPTEERQYIEDVAAGRMAVPTGQSVQERREATPSQISGIFEDYQAGNLPDNIREAYERDVRTGRMPLPSGYQVEMGRIGPVEQPVFDPNNIDPRFLVTEESGPIIPDITPLTPEQQAIADQNAQQSRGLFDLTGEYAAEGGGDLAGAALRGVFSPGEHTPAQQLGVPPILAPTADLGLAALGTVGAVTTGAAGLAGDVASMFGMSDNGSESLARDLAGMGEAFAGSPMAFTSPVTVAGRNMRPASQSVVTETIEQAPTPQGPPTPRFAEPLQSPRTGSVNDAVGQEMGELIARAARGGRGSEDARQRIAAMADVNPEAAQAAQRLGIELPGDVFADNAAVQQAMGSIRAVRGSDAAIQWQETFESAQEAAQALIAREGGGRNMAALSDEVQESIEGSIATLRQQGSEIFERIGGAVPTSARVQPSSTVRALSGLIEELGGPESLSPPVRRIYEAATSGQGMTYGRLMQERRQLSRALRNSGPYMDADEREIAILRTALTEDQRNFIEAMGGDDLVRELDRANELWASAAQLQDDLAAGFGRNGQNNIARTIADMQRNPGRASLRRFNRILDVVPDHLRRDVLLSGIDSLSQARSGQGGFSFANYARTFRTITENRPMYNRLVAEVGVDTANVMRDLYDVSVRVDRAAQNVPRTGASNQALLQAMNTNTLFERVMNSSAGRSTRAVAAGTATSAVAGPAVGSLAAMSSGTARIGRDRARIVSHFLRSPQFQDLAVEVATQPQASAETVQRVIRSPAYRRWANATGIENPEQWIWGAIGAQQVNQGMEAENGN